MINRLNKPNVSNVNNKVLAQSPIVITGNADFKTKGTENGWIGDGSKNNPYIIDGLIFSSLSSTDYWAGIAGALMLISNIAQYFSMISESS